MPKVLQIDNQYKEGDMGSKTMIAVFSAIANIVPAYDITLLDGFSNVEKYLRTQSLNEQNLVVFIHESFNLEWSKAFEMQEREAVTHVCETIRQKNPRARIIIYGFGLHIPVKCFIEDAKADGLWNHALVSERRFRDILTRGPVSNEEMALRGKNIEQLSSGCRIASSVEVLTWKVPKDAYVGNHTKKERWGD